MFVSDISNGFHTNGNHGNASKLYYGIINTKVTPLNLPDLNKYTPQKVKFSMKDFSSKCDHIRRIMRIWSHLLKKSLMENFIFCVVLFT